MCTCEHTDFMKFFLEVQYSLICLILNFNKHPTFSCRDICKMILMFFNHSFSIFIFPQLCTPKAFKDNQLLKNRTFFLKLDMKMYVSN